MGSAVLKRRLVEGGVPEHLIYVVPSVYGYEAANRYCGRGVSRVYQVGWQAHSNQSRQVRAASRNHDNLNSRLTYAFVQSCQMGRLAWQPLCEGPTIVSQMQPVRTNCNLGI